MKRTLVVVFVLLCAGCGADMLDSNLIHGKDRPNHHTASGFRNNPSVPDGSSLGIGFFLRRLWGALFPPSVPPGHVVNEQEALARFHGLNGHDTVTWLGQSAFLIRMNGTTILTDPFLTEYASPFIRGPKRYVRPGIALNNLPPIDVLVISHNHHDHLDPKTIGALPNKDRTTVFVPLGLKNFFQERGYTRIHELDWWQNATLDAIRFTALPAAHMSGRGLTDTNDTLWCSWAIMSTAKKVFFSGDTAYSPGVFKAIGNTYGDFDIALVPIGAYEPRDGMRVYHTTPEEAVQIGLDVKAATLVAMHWGTIELSDEPHGEPPRKFRDAADKAGFHEHLTWLMKIGETRLFP